MDPSKESENTELLPSAPFDDTRADFILRSSDGMNFRVFKTILSLASPIFADMFNIPQPTSENLHDGLPFVTLSEDSKTLDLALRHLYPVRSPTRVELGDARVLAEFARKYQVDALESVILRSLTDSIEDDPVGVYVIAVTYGHKTIGRTTALSTLKLPIARLQSLHLQFTMAGPYGELVQYYTACGAAASAVALERKWFSSWEARRRFVSTSPGSPSLRCQICATRDLIGGLSNQTSRSSLVSAMGTNYGPRCLWSYLNRSFLVLAQHPAAEAVTTEEFVLKSFDCVRCPSGTLRDLLEFSQIFGAEVENALKEVPLPNCL
ncbi:hypothetical protein BJV78DRAFT_1279015 [Lactifluus subvellereus]|nr:hypothetical protein BJV78DRAFT_1279015 [Lactifluus subvellereus]